MKLYELSNNFQALYESLEDFTDEDNGDLQQAWFDTLDGIEAEFMEKAENVAVYIKMLKAEAEALANEEKLIKARKDQKKKRVESLSQYLLNGMQQVSLKKIDRPMAVISVRNNAESVVIDDEQTYIDWATQHAEDTLKYKAPEISKTEVKKLLQAGKELPACHITRTQSVIIK